MEARNKLNTVAITGSLLLSSIIGLATNSWLVFIVMAMILLGLSCYSGDIRTGKRD